MLPKSQRLNLKHSFKFVRSGKKFETISMQVYARLGENIEPLAAVSLRTKSFPKAVVRNKVKRLTFEAISQVYPKLKKNLNLVIIPKDNILNYNLQNLTQQLYDIKDLY